MSTTRTPGHALPVAVDGMGGDRGVATVVQGVAAAAVELGCEVLLVGREEALRTELARYPEAARRITVVPAAEAISMDESPLALRRKDGSSIAMGLRLVREGRAGAFVSAGHTGAVFLWANTILGTLPGVERPALSAVLPSVRGPFLLLDVGANPDCRPSDLLSFARMGTVYAERVLRVPRPRVGLLSNGEEESKGNLLVRETHGLLKASGLEFVGNLESKDLPRGAADVVVADGFTGNIVIKTAEGAAEVFMDLLRSSVTSRWHYRLAALVLRPALRAAFQRLDYTEFGGAPLLGMQGVVIVAHGRSDARAMRNAVRVGVEAAARGVVGALQGMLLPEGAR
ncbi:MAG: phosphate acyltransferase PlsX [Chloroflexi bacterium]|nr:phosphate acyltransferase PlsX [Chloroflexota bacterium]